jgi:predicted RNA-binding protein with PIN domain
LSTQQKIVVDGYNVIYADDKLRRIALKDMERARREFLCRVEAYVADKELRVTVVFDGSGDTTDTRAIVPGKLQAVFSARRQSADELIVSIIANSENPRSYIVVTSDRAHIRPAVAGLGCRSIGAKSFLDRVSGRTPARSRPEKEEKPQPGSEDMNFWLDRFGADAEGDP